MGDAGPSTETLSPARAGLLVRRFRLRVLQGPDAGVCFESQGERVTLGTHKRCDMTLTDPAASRFNCEIALGGQGAVITDLESRNGTLVDGVSILSAHLVDGAVLTIGRTRIRFELGDERIPIPLSDRDRFGLLVGRSTPMRATFELLSRAAASDVPVLLHGETGTGKELAAESIHRESERRDEPFVVLDCSAVPGGLLESEIFGHERGAFTDAIRQRAGVFEAAGGGTVFLDEIGELEPSLQRKLLRVAEAGQIVRVGGEAPIPIRARIVAASNRSLPAEVNAGRFRADLYYRLAVLEVTLPPLRARLDDIPLLVDHLLGELGASPAAGERLRAAAFLASLARYNWPGNVRELRNHLGRCLVLEETPLPGSTAPPLDGVDVSLPLRTARERWLHAFERAYLGKLLEVHGDNVSAAARAAGVDRTYLHRVLSRLGLR